MNDIFNGANIPSPIKIYVASSFRNISGVKLLNAMLQEKGFHVLDWTTLAPPVSDKLTPEQRKAKLDEDEHGQVFIFCRNACAQADAVIYYGPAGQDAGIEIGIAYNAGVIVYGLRSPTEAPGTMLNGCVTKWFDDPLTLIKDLECQFRE